MNRKRLTKFYSWAWLALFIGLTGILVYGKDRSGTGGDVFLCAAKAGTYGSLEGTVTDSVTGNGVYGAQVKVDLGKSNFVTTYTMSGGYFLFNNTLPQGSGYKVKISKPNYNAWSGKCPEIKSGRSNLNVTLAATAGTGLLAGTVQDGATPIPGAYLVISTYAVVAGPDGTYTIRLAKGTNHTLRATAGGYQTANAGHLAVTPGQTTTFNVKMTRQPAAPAQWKTKAVSFEGARFELDFIDHTPGQGANSVITVNKVRIVAEGLTKIEVGREDGKSAPVIESAKSNQLYTIDLACLWPATAPGRGIYVKATIKDKLYTWYPFKGGTEGELNGQKPKLEGVEKINNQGEKVCASTN